MTPEVKAKQLFDMFLKVGCVSFKEAEENSAQKSALLAVDEILGVLDNSNKKYGFFLKVKEELKNSNSWQR